MQIRAFVPACLVYAAPGGRWVLAVAHQLSCQQSILARLVRGPVRYFSGTPSAEDAAAGRDRQVRRLASCTVVAVLCCRLQTNGLQGWLERCLVCQGATCCCWQNDTSVRVCCGTPAVLSPCDHGEQYMCDVQTGCCNPDRPMSNAVYPSCCAAGWISP
jgi:hypothetical protein